MTERSQRRPRILLDHGEAYGNLGDEAMLLNAVRRIREHVGSCELVVPRREGMPLPDLPGCETVVLPPPFPASLADSELVTKLVRRFPLDAPWRLAAHAAAHRPLNGDAAPWQGLAAEVGRCDAIYCVGAANMNQWTRRGQLLKKWLLMRLARRRGIPVVASSQAVGPFKDGWALRMAADAVRRASDFTFRDRGLSRRVLQGAGLNLGPSSDVGDEAFSLPASSEQAAVRLLGEAGVDPTEPFGILHFRSTDYLGRTDRHLPKLAAALDNLPDEPIPVFLPMSRGFHSPPDADCATALKEQMKHPERLRVLPCPEHPGAARRLVRMACWVVSLSYHLQVFAMVEGTPVLPLVSGGYYRHKAAGLVAWTDDRVPVADLDAAGADEVGQMVRGLETSRSAHAAILKEAAERMRPVNDRPPETLARLVRSPSAAGARP